MIAERRPDVVFLDVQMPRIDGFGVVEAVGASRMPPVVFVTAHDVHAVRAFEVHAVDYLLKPIEPDRFRDAFDRACRAASQDDLSAIRASLATLIPAARFRANVPAPATDCRIRVRHEGQVTLVDPREIDWVEAAGNYVVFHLRGTTLRHRATMEEMHATLGDAFLRIRRAVLVRVAAVRSCEARGKGSYVVKLHDGTRLLSSRYFRSEIGSLIDG